MGSCESSQTSTIVNQENSDAASHLLATGSSTASSSVSHSFENSATRTSTKSALRSCEISIKKAKGSQPAREVAAGLHTTTMNKQHTTLTTEPRIKKVTYRKISANTRGAETSPGSGQS